MAEVRRAARFILKADIARFYPSIYTHSIPWALYGRAAAKASRKPSASIGNRLDYWARMGQSQQTIGIPIGPDTSWVLSEVVRVAVELDFASEFGRKPPGCVLIDDFELAFRTLPDAEQALAVLEASLNRYELSLNPKKTEILPLPQPLGSLWPEDLASFTIRPGTRNQATDFVRYFNRVFEHSRTHPDEHVISYAISRLRKIDVDGANWDTYQSLILQCMVVEPGCLQFAEPELRRHRAAGHTIDRDALAKVLETIITSAGPPGHASEVCWAIWIGIIFDVRLGANVSRTIEVMGDSFVALLALHADQLGLFTSSPDRTRWETFQVTNALWEDQWLLAYEANAKGWLPSKGGGDHVSADARFDALKQGGITFYHDGLAPAPVGIGRVPLSPFGYPLPW